MYSQNRNFLLELAHSVITLFWIFDVDSLGADLAPYSYLQSTLLAIYKRNGDLKQNHILVSKLGFGLDVLLQLHHDSQAICDIFETQHLLVTKIYSIAWNFLGQPLCLPPHFICDIQSCRGRVGRCLGLSATVLCWRGSCWAFGCWCGMGELCLGAPRWHGPVMCHEAQEEQGEWVASAAPL